MKYLPLLLLLGLSGVSYAKTSKALIAIVKVQYPDNEIKTFQFDSSDPDLKEVPLKSNRMRCLIDFDVASGVSAFSCFPILPSPDHLATTVPLFCGKTVKQTTVFVSESPASKNKIPTHTIEFACGPR